MKGRPRESAAPPLSQAGGVAEEIAMRSSYLRMTIGLYILVGVLSSQPLAAGDRAFTRLTTDGKCSMDNWGMVAPVTGRIAYYRQVCRDKRQLIVTDGDGKNAVVVDQVGLPGNATWSPDGTTLAYTWESGTSDSPERAVRVCRYGDRSPTTLTKGSANYTELAWSQNGRYMAARKSHPDANRTTLSVLDVANGRETDIAANHQDSTAGQYAVSWSPDSSQVCFASQQSSGDTYGGLWVCNANGTGLKLLTPRGCDVSSARWGPPGDWIAFSSSYKRVDGDGWGVDVWLVRPSGKDMHPVTNGSSADWRRFQSFMINGRTEDGHYLVVRHDYPDIARHAAAKGWAYVDAEEGAVILVAGADIATSRRESGTPYWTMSPNGKRFFCYWTESEVHNLGSSDESAGTTWFVASAFDLASRTRRELLRLETPASRMRLSGWPGFSPDGRRVYLTVQKVISESEGIYESDVAYIDLDQPTEAPLSPQPPQVDEIAPTPAQETAPTPTATQPSAPTNGHEATVRLQVMNIRADEALSLLPKEEQAFVTADVKRNCLLVTAPVGTPAAIERDLRTIDVTPPQIAVDVLVIELSKQAARDLGLDLTYSKGHWAALTPLGQTSRLGPTDSDRLPLLSSNPSGLGEFVFQGVGELPHTFFAHLQALETSGDARIEASPTVVATSGKEATITVRQRVNFFYTTGYDITGRPTLAKSDISADINMKILPTLLGNGKVLLEVDALVGSFTFKSSGALPDTTDRQVATSLTVGDGQTVVLGGLKQQQSTIVHQRVPILGALPLVGSLFRHTSRTSTDNVLTVLITPRVVAAK